MNQIKQLKGIANIAEWWCKLMEIDDYSRKISKETLKSVVDMYWQQLFEASKDSKPQPPYIGKICEKDAKEFRKVIAKYGYQSPDDFNRELFAFQAETIGCATNFGLFIY